MPPRKGGGRKAFLKGVHTAHDPPPESGAQPHKEPAASSSSADVPSEQKSEPKPSAVKAAKAAVKPEVPRHEDAAPAEDSSHKDETRGQMVQRHKRETKEHKEKAKKLGKKMKDEMERVEKAMEVKHAAELSELETRLGLNVKPILVVTDSLYDFKLTPEDDKPAEASKKPTKAQKRRGQRAQHEAEREAQIEEERAEQGPSARALEEAELASQLAPLGLAIREIQADGHCLYRSVEDQLRLVGKGEAASVPGFLELRKRAAVYMRAHRDDFIAFGDFTPEDGEAEGSGADLFEDYCHQVEDSAAWGGELELRALAQALEACITVFSTQLPTHDMGQEFKGKGLHLQVCYQQHAYGLGEHYNSVGPIQAVEDESD